MSRASRAAALTADLDATHRRIDEVTGTMPGLHGAALDRQVRAAVVLVNEAADLETKIRTGGGTS